MDLPWYPYERNYYLDVSTRTRNSSLPWEWFWWTHPGLKNDVSYDVSYGGSHPCEPSPALGAFIPPNLQGEASIIYQGFKLQALKVVVFCLFNCFTPDPSRNDSQSWLAHIFPLVAWNLKPPTSEKANLPIFRPKQIETCWTSNHRDWSTYPSFKV